MNCRFLIQIVLNSDSMNDFNFKIRKAEKKDCQIILEFIFKLAKYEKAESEVKITLEDLQSSGFSNPPIFHALILEENIHPIGFALYYFRYSTWNGKNLYLEDLYIDKEQRGKGYGINVMYHLAELANIEKCGRFEWQVLDWNEASINFYKKIGAILDSEWINCRMNKKEINEFLFRYKP
jgi:RimJ/RimL family protein N-acetyltransferase